MSPPHTVFGILALVLSAQLVSGAPLWSPFREPDSDLVQKTLDQCKFWEHHGWDWSHNGHQDVTAYSVYSIPEDVDYTVAKQSILKCKKYGGVHREEDYWLVSEFCYKLTCPGEVDRSIAPAFGLPLAVLRAFNEERHKTRDGFALIMTSARLEKQGAKTLLMAKICLGRWWPTERLPGQACRAWPGEIESCYNGLKDNQETDIDCGGRDCGPCVGGQVCKESDDCWSGICENKRCKGRPSP